MQLKVMKYTNLKIGQKVLFVSDWAQLGLQKKGL